MLADLDLLLIAVFCTADDLLPKRAENARRMITDAEVVTLCVAQALLGVPSDRRFLALAARRLGHLFSTAAAATGVLQAPPTPQRRDRGADRRVCPSLRRLGRHRAGRRLHPGRMRAQRRDGPAQPARRRRR